MSLSDNLRRLARERIPTGAGKWLGPISPITPTRSSRLGVHFFTRGGVPTDFGPLTDGGGLGAAATAFFSSSTTNVFVSSEAPISPRDLRSRSPAG